MWEFYTIFNIWVHHTAVCEIYEVIISSIYKERDIRLKS